MGTCELAFKKKKHKRKSYMWLPRRRLAMSVLKNNQDDETFLFSTLCDGLFWLYLHVKHALFYQTTSGNSSWLWKWEFTCLSRRHRKSHKGEGIKWALPLTDVALIQAVNTSRSLNNAVLAQYIYLLHTAFTHWSQPQCSQLTKYTVSANTGIQALFSVLTSNTQLHTQDMQMTLPEKWLREMGRKTHTHRTHSSMALFHMMT